MNVEILTVGSELLNGRKADLHGAWLGARLHALGCAPRFHTSVADDAADLGHALELALGRSDVVIACGGLGPTLDDLTREAAAQATGLKLREDPGVRASLEAFFASRQRPMPPNNLRQALVPEGAEVLPNPKGTAPGLRIPHGGRTLFLLPGPPRELHAVFEASVLPWLRAACKAAPRFERSLCSWGISESGVDALLAGLVPDGDTRTLSMLAHEGGIEVRLSCESPAELARLEAEACARLGDAVFSSEGRSLEEVVLELLLAKKASLALAESCTGGRIAAKVTGVPGASRALLAGMVTYSDAAKQQFLDVPPFVLKKAGAVSKDTALAMAVGLARRTGADYCLAVTGVAGPGGGTPEKPVGRVHFALASPEGVAHQEFSYGPLERAQIQSRAAMSGLFLLYSALAGIPIPELGQDRAALPGNPPPARA